MDIFSTYDIPSQSSLGRLYRSQHPRRMYFQAFLVCLQIFCTLSTTPSISTYPVRSDKRWTCELYSPPCVQSDVPTQFIPCLTPGFLGFKNSFPIDLWTRLCRSDMRLMANPLIWVSLPFPLPQSRNSQSTTHTYILNLDSSWNQFFPHLRIWRLTPITLISSIR